MYGNKQKEALSVTLIFAMCWLLNIYVWWLLRSSYIPTGGPLLTLVPNVLLYPFISYTAPPHIKQFCSGQLVGFFA